MRTTLFRSSQVTMIISIQRKARARKVSRKKILPSLQKRCCLTAILVAHKKHMKILKHMLLASVLIAFVGCKEKGPMEKAGESIDKAAKDTTNAAKDAVEKAKDAPAK